MDWPTALGLSSAAASVGSVRAALELALAKSPGATLRTSRASSRVHVALGRLLPRPAQAS
ncbi:MAG: hypothetical protein IPQ09_25210 [Myxococcales bacterium]|nr:hypothetical protein [Myxococcales bacterium]